MAMWLQPFGGLYVTGGVTKRVQDWMLKDRRGAPLGSSWIAQAKLGASGTRTVVGASVVFCVCVCVGGMVAMHHRSSMIIVPQVPPVGSALIPCHCVGRAIRAALYRFNRRTT